LRSGRFQELRAERGCFLKSPLFHQCMELAHHLLEVGCPERHPTGST